MPEIVISLTPGPMGYRYQIRDIRGYADDPVTALQAGMQAWLDKEG